MRHLVVGTAGHIDHGKSTLVEALTGIDPDRLAEEKRRGITIDLGFADLELGPGRVVSFVDVPGHERFVRHMVAGATGIDAVMLVVAADQGVQPQTIEHLAICRLLRVAHGLVVLTKCDLVDADLVEVAALELRELVGGTFLETAPVVGVSARSGAGLPALRTALGALFDRVPERSSRGVARLPVDRAFVLRGFGTVVTGTLVSGRLAEGDEVEVLPGGKRGRIRGIQVHRRRETEALAGRRTALNLQGLDCADVPRGATVTSPGALLPTRRVWAWVELLPAAPAALARGGPVRFHQGTAERAARLRTLGREADGTLRAEIFLRGDTVLAPGDRFILRRPAPVDTVGGGTVIDVRPPRARQAFDARLGRAASDAATALGLRVERAGASGRESAELAAELGLTREQLERGAGELERRGALVRCGTRWFAGDLWRDLAQRALAELDRRHAADPLRAGVSREELRAALSRELPQEAWRALLAELEAGSRVRLAQDKVARADHRVVLAAEERQLAERIEQRLRAGGLEPPDWESVVPAGERARAERILDLLIASGAVVRIPDGKLFHAAALEQLREKLRAYAERSRTIDVGAFKELAGVTRKHAIPLLEYLDAQRVTRRHGNLRQIL